MTAEGVKRVLEYWVVQEFIEASRSKHVAMMMEFSEQIDGMLKKSLDAVESVLDDEGAPADVKLRAATTVLDRHPSGLFQKRSRSEHVTETRNVDSTVIEEIKREALIEGTSEPIEEVKELEGPAETEGPAEGEESEDLF